MTRWGRISGTGSGEDYAERFDRLAASGADVHGEADLCSRLVDAPARILDAGCGTGRVAVELSRRGYDCVGVDLDPSMLAVARSRGPGVTWIEADLAGLELGGEPFDLVVMAGNVMPLLEEGTEAEAVAAVAGHVRPDGLIVAGFGLDGEHLPLDEAPFDLDQYDAWCSVAGLQLVDRLTTWEGLPYDGGGYAVSLHRRLSGESPTTRA